VRGAFGNGSESDGLASGTPFKAQTQFRAGILPGGNMGNTEDFVATCGTAESF
jgi:hypothetical protein